MLKREIQEIINNPREEFDRENTEAKRGENLWRQEEMYWGMRARISWLKWGDKNTKYFRATTIQRRQRNRISMLKDVDDVWHRDQSHLKRMTLDFFQELFSSGGQKLPPCFESMPQGRSRGNESNAHSRSHNGRGESCSVPIGSYEGSGTKWFEWLILLAQLGRC